MIVHLHLRRREITYAEVLAMCAVEAESGPLDVALLWPELTPQERLENEITGDRWLRDAPPSPKPAAPAKEKLDHSPWAKRFPFGAGGKNDR